MRRLTSAEKAGGLPTAQSPEGGAAGAGGQAEKAELAALKDAAPEIDADAESRARLAALKGTSGQPDKPPPAKKPKFRTAQAPIPLPPPPSPPPTPLRWSYCPEK